MAEYKGIGRCPPEKFKSQNPNPQAVFQSPADTSPINYQSFKMVFQYKEVLMIGGTAGIGAGMADRLIQEGSKVIVVGRRQDRIDSFVEKHGSDKAGGIKFDLSDVGEIDKFVSTVTQEHPDIDCVFLNAGVQRPANLADPAKMDLGVFHSQILVNFTAFVDLTVKFLPFLLSKKSETSLI